MKLRSSDWLTADREIHERDWGHYQVVYEHPGIKVKVLTLNPGKIIPLQLHRNHDEHWLVLSGQGATDLSEGDGTYKNWEMVPGEVYDIKAGRAHSILAYAGEEEPLVFLEVQVGLIVPGGDAELVNI